MTLLSVEDLQVSFSTRNGVVRALHGISFDLDAGQTLGIVGESGSGKSVTSLAIMRLLDRAGQIDKGRVTFQGRDITKAKAGELRSLRGAAMSMIFQNPRAALNPIRTVRDQIVDVLRAHKGMTAADARKQALTLLEAVRIRDAEKRLHAYPGELSGGMCQRVMIAMAIACEPALLIADEPTTGLDVTTQKVVMDLLAGITAEHGMATILITHDLGLAAKYCGSIAVMEKGLIVERGETEALFRGASHPYTRRLIAASPTRTSTLADLADLDPSPPPSCHDRAKPGHRTGTGAGAAGETRPSMRASASLHPVRSPGTGHLLELQHVVKTFSGGVKAVDDVSFHLEPGGSLGLVGESGSGKTTLSRMICRLLDADGGDIVFLGESIARVPANDFHRAPQRRDIQIVFQDPNDSLNPRFTAFDSIAHPLRRLEHLKDGATLADRVRQAAERAGLPAELLTRFPHQLSGGQKARVGIARAIAPRPKLLVLDEPTAALDVSIQAVILQLLDRLRREDDIALLFVSHDLNVVRMLCDQIVVLRQGKVVETGASQAVFDSPRDDYTRALLDAIPHFEPAGGRLAFAG
ncbi:MAG TPA: ABC transporter ATP-binding protein [Rhodopila sp.]|uniref:ABC transporter ATP-binding protein n=1 Tax=Rhodopila sp. TaxID=2480087 RepID=UPI002BC1C744|nr:ABC transporter ATP-binding protein [Rhodopila sp.]HVY15187.1 ABC transporter ATP-binding protein [Rhodopila sp.]